MQELFVLLQANLIYALVGIYLFVGLIYAFYVVLNGGGTILSIPLNIVFGPVFIPINIFLAYRVMMRKGRKGGDSLTENEVEQLIKNLES